MCINETGNFNSLMSIFNRANPVLMDNAPLRSFATYSKSGWISNKTFLVWFKRFVEFSNLSKEKPILLLLEKHSSHTKYIELINTTRENHMILLCFSPHTTHCIQPLDVSLMAALSTY